jgi:hypothetical protein
LLGLVRHVREDGSGTLSVELPRDALELVLQALELIGSRLPETRAGRSSPETPMPWCRWRRRPWPGCHHERFVEAHHIHHWADGGETSLANLTLLCSAHHKLLHEGGYSIERRGDGTFYFARPDRRPVEELRRSYRVGFSAGNRACARWWPGSSP